ncbi:MAG: AMP-binding enzyme [Chloroflexota bacterium]
MERELIQYAREQMAVYKRPRWVTFVEQLPKTATGKIQRFKLRELAAGFHDEEVSGGRTT